MELASEFKKHLQKAEKKTNSSQPHDRTLFLEYCEQIKRDRAEEKRKCEPGGPVMIKKRHPYQDILDILVAYDVDLRTANIIFDDLRNLANLCWLCRQLFDKEMS